MAFPLQLDPDRFTGWIRGQQVGLYQLQSADGMSASICNQGARLLQLLVPSASGAPVDVVLGYDSLAQMLEGLASMGATIGRYANRICNASFPLHGRLWHTPPNEGMHSLHGGPAGCRYQVFRVAEQSSSQIKLGWTFLEAEDGFPGDVDLEVCYSLPGKGVLAIDFTALPSRSATVLSFTNHAFFNLEGAGSVACHRLQSDADQYLQMDAEKIPTGQLSSVQGSNLDFLREAQVDSGWKPHRGASSTSDIATPDHCLVMPNGNVGSLQRLATVSAPNSGLQMQVWSDAPAFQLYVGGGPNAKMTQHIGKQGQIYDRFSAICIEPQAYPDAPNHSNFPSVDYEPGVVFRQRIEYRFSAPGKLPA